MACSPIGLILACVLPGAKKQDVQDRLSRIRERRRESEEKRELQRLEEERRLERQQNQQLHYALMNRLSPPASAPFILPPNLKPDLDSPPPLPAETPAEELWHVVVSDKKLGPLTIEMLVNLAKNKRIGPDTLVWRKGYFLNGHH